MKQSLTENDKILWEGKPCFKPFIFRNIVEYFKDSASASFVTLAAILILYLALTFMPPRQFGTTWELWNIIIIVPILFAVNLILLLRKLYFIKNTRYFITEKHIHLFEENKDEAVIIAKERIIKRTLKDSIVDREYRVDTIELMTDEVEEENPSYTKCYLIESISNADEVLELMK